MGGVTIMDTAGDEIEVEAAKETGRYYDPAGVPRQINAGDPIPPGWKHENDFTGTPGNEAPEPDAGDDASKKGRKPRASK